MQLVVNMVLNKNVIAQTRPPSSIAKFSSDGHVMNVGTFNDGLGSAWNIYLSAAWYAHAVMHFVF